MSCPTNGHETRIAPHFVLPQSITTAIIAEVKTSFKNHFTVEKRGEEKMKIRAAIRDDFHDIHRLLMEVHQLHHKNRPDVYRDGDPMTKEDFLDVLENQRAFLLIAEIDGTVAGYCTVTIRDPRENPLLVPHRVAYMEELCVDMKYRRRKIGERLMKAAEDEARKKGAEKMELMVWAFNNAAVEFYRKMEMSTRCCIMEKYL